MDVEDFLKSNKPASGSRLAPFLNDLRRLRGLGYSLKQVQDYLAAQEIHVTVQNISAYLHRQQGHKPLKQTSQTINQDASTTIEGANNAKDNGEDRGPDPKGTGP